MTEPDIPLENLAGFLSVPRSCAVWWSPADRAVLGVYVEYKVEPTKALADAVRLYVSRRPRKCYSSDCWDDADEPHCEERCLTQLMRMIEHPLALHTFEIFTEYDQPTNPGIDALNALRDRWAAQMGWTAR